MHRTALTLAGLAATAALALTGCSSSSSPSSSPAADGTPSPVVMTSFPDLPAPSGEPVLDGIASAAPTDGAVGRIPGPFDDRFRFGEVRFDGRRVTGSLQITSDVSDVLELQVLAGFYDRSGRLLGSARFTHHLDESTHHDDGPPSEREEFTIAVPKRLAARGEVASAAVGVPVLVNE